jgi:hypothetical protein
MPKSMSTNSLASSVMKTADEQLAKLPSLVMPVPDWLSTPTQSAIDSLINLVLLATTAIEKVTNKMIVGFFIRNLNRSRIIAIMVQSGSAHIMLVRIL